MRSKERSERLDRDLQLLAAAATLVTSAVMLFAWIKTWPASVLLTGLGVLGILGAAFAVWRVAIAPVMAWQVALVQEVDPRLAFRLIVLYPVLLFPVATGFALAYLIEARRAGLTGFVGVGLILVCLVVMRTGALLLLTDEKARVRRVGWSVRQLLPTPRQALLGFAIATSFVHPWSARVGGVLVLLLLVPAFGYWVAERYWGVPRQAPLVLAPWRMLGMRISPVPMGPPVCPSDLDAETNDVSASS